MPRPSAARGACFVSGLEDPSGGLGSPTSARVEHTSTKDSTFRVRGEHQFCCKISTALEVQVWFPLDSTHRTRIDGSMPPYLSPLHIAKATIPANCEPANEFLYHFSAVFHTCIPTNLALISTLLGTCSIISWLFAQLPQIYKNHKLKSTSGLSAFFLTEWLLGDVTNLLGCLFTGQALWQIIIATYYVFVDCCLCAQWVWYEMLHHGRPLRPIWGRWSGTGFGGSGMHQVRDGMMGGNKGKTSSPPQTPDSTTTDKTNMSSESAAQNIPRSSTLDTFRIPNFARSPNPVKESWQDMPSGTSPNPHVRRVAASSSPMPSPKTILYISLMLAILTNPTLAKPVSPFAPAPLTYHTTTLAAPLPASHLSTSEILGKLFSWMSTFLYLGSRLPQLYKNQIRRSTAGLSPVLFAAAFFGNLFYSTSLLANPCAWYDFPAGKGAGWVGPQGSVRRDWVLRAMPFFLGAAGVLIMDAAVGLQFVYFHDNENESRGRSRDDEVILTLDDHGKTVRRRLHWRRVSGWMRGWAPAVSVAATPSSSRAPTPSPRDESAGSVGSEASSSTSTSASSGIPIQGGKGNALDEARALLGTGRHASPRSYGALGSPR
ncbi:PQ-loop-domain-containing protein [Plenodomus tracheiphilus IPT5]|uniref:PQ-loop-domain-containing protein n=1 Tax=Plenodomus tracheiphilus IPT5 TaxID=1408161 RepID=A0A6A7B7V2_9PLEO|nr:PQ-loop-domain-containing protein [Plenodomus tracheiphilus IPT5]